MIYYFAYGSNMDSQNLDDWCRRKGLPVVKFLTVFPAKLSGYKLAFNYFSSTRNGGAANIMESEGDYVYGLLLELEDRDLNTIRFKEGYSRDRSKRYYDEIRVDVETFDKRKIRDVVTYKVVKKREARNHQPPTKEYLDLLIRNAERYSFPADYIKYLKTVPAKD